MRLLDRGRTLREQRRALTPVPGSAGMALGEAVRWSGRRGLGAIGKMRLILVAMAAPWPLLVAWLLWKAWGWSLASGELFDILFRGVGSTLVIFAFLGPAAVFVLRAAGPFFGDIAVEVFGKLVVTDRRIAFVAFGTGRVDREIRAERLIDVAVASQSRRSAHVHLIMRGLTDSSPETLDLFAVPDAKGAVAAMTRLIRP